MDILSSFTNMPVDEALDYLNQSYEDGVKAKKFSLRDYDLYLHGSYPSGKILIIGGMSPSRLKPPIDARYRSWFNSVAIRLSPSSVPQRFNGLFLDSETQINLDDEFTKKSIRNAYDKSLEALLSIINTLDGKGAESLKIISLRKINNLLYVHIDPDDRNVLIHKFNPESPLLRVFELIYANERVPITSSSIHVDSQGSNQSRNISEDLRAMHISINLKRLFFPECSASKTVFNNRVELSSDELDKLLTGLKTDYANR
jgi:hypothetical protein